jgi:shikimate dehydrogenase
MKFAVLGQPIAQSQSPQIHQWFAEQLGQTISYERIEVAPEAFAERLAALHAQGYQGLNVTSPHKLAALTAASAKAPRATPTATASCATCATT